jgi:hypothetical protein
MLEREIKKVRKAKVEHEGGSGSGEANDWVLFGGSEVNVTSGAL